MIRLVFTIIAGVLLGGIVHLVSVLVLPRIATEDAYSRLTPITKLNAVTQLAPADPTNALMLRLYDTPVGVATRTQRDAPMPTITTVGCP